MLWLLPICHSLQRFTDAVAALILDIDLTIHTEKLEQGFHSRGFDGQHKGRQRIVHKCLGNHLCGLLYIRKNKLSVFHVGHDWDFTRKKTSKALMEIALEVCENWPAGLS